ncbi:universal stress protein [Arthrobacter sp. UYEF3]|uniref:universal stress protein n=1 Tax=Arthrobacter sp. UYEF3 TaxID=1756365 RepID=UPI00339621C2
MFSRILVAIDTTPHSAAFLEQARDLAVATGAAVELMHFIGHDWTEGQDLTMEDQSRAQDQVNAALLTLPKPGSQPGRTWWSPMRP